MSNLSKIVIVIVIILAVIVGIRYWGSETQEVSDSLSIAPTQGLGADASDDTLDQDVTAIDYQLQALSQDGSRVDEGLNDTPVIIQ